MNRFNEEELKFKNYVEKQRKELQEICGKAIYEYLDLFYRPRNIKKIWNGRKFKKIITRDKKIKLKVVYDK